MHGGQSDPASNHASIAEARGSPQLTISAENLLTTTSTSCPQFSATVRSILVYSWVNVLLVFVPLAIVTYVTEVHPAVVFTLNVIAIIALSGLLTCATETLLETWETLLAP
jgi:Ca2+:H+ antiporter